MQKKLKFETALGKLEEIVRKLEDGSLDLRDALSAFENGISLVNLCNQELEEAEKKIEILLKNSSGTKKRTQFDPQITD